MGNKVKQRQKMGK